MPAGAGDGGNLTGKINEMLLKKEHTIFYAPNFEEVEGAYWFGPVRPSVTHFVGC